MLVGVVACSSSAVTTVSGVGDNWILEMTREPVTVTASTLLPSRARAPAVSASTLAAHISASLLYPAFLMRVPWIRLCLVGPKLGGIGSAAKKKCSATIGSSTGHRVRNCQGGFARGLFCKGKYADVAERYAKTHACGPQMRRVCGIPATHGAASFSWLRRQSVQIPDRQPPGARRPAGGARRRGPARPAAGGGAA